MADERTRRKKRDKECELCPADRSEPVKASVVAENLRAVKSRQRRGRDSLKQGDWQLLKETEANADQLQTASESEKSRL